MPLLEYWCQSVEDLAQHLYGVYFITVCAVLGATGPPSAGSGQGAQVPASAVVPRTPGAAASSGGVRGRRFFGLPPSALGPEWEGGI